MSKQSEVWIIEARTVQLYKVQFSEPVTREQAAHQFLTSSELDILDENELEREAVLSLDSI